MDDEFFKKQVAALREKSNAGLQDCKQAMEKCEDFDVAYEYLRMRGQAVLRRKRNEFGELVRWTDEDYIEQARIRVELERNQKNDY